MMWAGKIAAKVVLSRLPVSYRRWAGLGLFKLGRMADPDYALKIFFKHYDSVFNGKSLEGKTFLEMGCGDSVASALIAASLGVQKIYLVDAGDYATRDMVFYRRMAEALRLRGYEPPSITQDMSFTQMLEVCRAEYLTGGLEGWSKIPEGSVDYAWSHSTLEHVRKHEFLATMQALYKVMAPGGIVSHNVDLQDHLGGNLNNLRFSEAVWEAEWMVRSGFYTNRLRASEIKSAFLEAGFEISDFATGTWERLPTSREKMATPFKNMETKDLLIRTLAAHLVKPAP